MLGHKTDASGLVRIVADHLDAVLAAGEDLLGMRLPPAADCTGSDGVAGERLVQFAAGAARQEAAIIAHVLQARRRVSELSRLPEPLRTIARLFEANTAGLLELILRRDQRALERFATGGDPVEYLRLRGAIAADRASQSRFAELAIDETFLLGGAVPVGPLLDLVAKFLDLLDEQFRLYPDEPRQLEALARSGEQAMPAGTTSGDSLSVYAQSAVTPGAVAAALDEFRKHGLN
jgi:hypothetical protein